MAFNVINTITEFDFENEDPSRNEEWTTVSEVEIGTRRSKSVRVDLRRMFTADDGNERPGKGFTFRNADELEAVIEGLQTGLANWRQRDAEAAQSAATEATEAASPRKPRRRKAAA